MKTLKKMSINAVSVNSESVLSKAELSRIRGGEGVINYCFTATGCYSGDHSACFSTADWGRNAQNLYETDYSFWASVCEHIEAWDFYPFYV